MCSARTLVNHWPLPIAALMSGAMIVSTVMDKVDLPSWLLDAFTEMPKEPDVVPSPPDTTAGIPYAPVPGWDDRTPLAYVSHVFELDDPDLPRKFSGVGPVYWRHGGRGSGTLIAPNVVLTTGHLFAENGKWEGPLGLTRKPPAPTDGYIYLEACAQSYELKAIHMGSMSPRARLGLDYAIVELVTPACDDAVVLPVAKTPDDLAEAADQIFLSLGAWAFDAIDRYASHPVFAEKASTNVARERQAVFGVRCKPTGRDDTGDVADGSTAVIVTEGCDGVPGGSGGAVVVSRDGGATYSIVGVTNSYRPNTEYNNYTRIEGAFAKHLQSFVDVIELPTASVTVANPSSIPAVDQLGPWEETDIGEDRP
ncbi:MAG: hypothetical protein AAFQ15_14950 [Pseudomonadota bacterium]